MAESDANSRDNRPDNWPAIVLIGIVVLLTAFNAVAWIYGDSGPGDDWLEFLLSGAWVFEPILFGIWAAFGTGSLVIRLPLLVPCLLILFVAPGLDKASLADVERYEFITMVLTGLAIFTVAMLNCLAVRWFTGCRIGQPSAVGCVGQSRIRFSMKYLLGTITVYAVLLGMATQLSFQTQPPSLATIFLGPDFYIYAIAGDGAIASGILLPIVAIPIFVLCDTFSKRAVRFAIAFWFVVSTLAVGFFAYIESETRLESLVLVLLLQLGAILVGLPVALPMRWAGFRLIGDRQADTPSSVNRTIATQ